MRQISSLSAREPARIFSDHLLSQGIRNRIVEQGGAYQLWVEREEDVDRARAELDAYLADPTAPQYRAAIERAGEIRKRAAREEAEHRRKTIDVRSVWTGPNWRRCPVTFAVIALSIAMGVYTRLGTDRRAIQPFLISKNVVELTRVTDDPESLAPAVPRLRSTGLDAVKDGEVWRLLTPIFLHFGPVHLIFNLYWFYQLAGMLELARGRWATLGLILFLAIGSNLAEYAWSAYRYGVDGMPGFGGLSGVLYGLFGYAWMKSEFEPNTGFVMPSQTVSVMLIWLVVCMLGVVGPVANAAHLGGLVLGLVAGIAPHLRREP